MEHLSVIKCCECGIAIGAAPLPLTPIFFCKNCALSLKLMQTVVGECEKDELLDFTINIKNQNKRLVSDNWFHSVARVVLEIFPELTNYIPEVGLYKYWREENVG